MRRQRTSIRLLIAATAAALLLGAAALTSPRPASACSPIPFTVEGFTTSASVIVVAEVAEAGERTASLRPEVFLKGPVSSGLLTLTADRSTNCQPASLAAGQRLVLFLGEAGGVASWPIASSVVYLDRGQAALPGSPLTTTEAALIAEIRHITEQYAVPASDTSEGAGIEWGRTVLPVGIALVVLMAVSLFLMRIWHRIDPS